MSNKLNRRIKLIGLSTFFGLLMFNFQNCAPPQIESTSLSGFVPDQVRTIDDWNQNKLLFVTSNQTFKDSAPDLTLHGVCNRKGENGILKYSISESGSGKEIESGLENDFCEGGGFRLKVQNIASINCDLSYQVYIKSSLGYEDLMFINKSCN